MTTTLDVPLLRDVSDAVYNRDGDDTAQRKFNPAKFGGWFKRHYRTRLGEDGRLWRFESGVYIPDADGLAEESVRQLLNSKHRKNDVTEVLGYLRAERPTIMSEPPPEVLNVANGLLEWQTENGSSYLWPHFDRPAFVSQIPISWNPSATCPAFDKFLSEVLPSDTIDLAWELLGYCLLPSAMYQRAAMLLGPGGNGKSTFINVATALLGRRNVTHVALQTFSEDRFAAAELYGKLANFFADLDARALKRTDIFKVVVGGDSMTAQRKYGPPFNFTPYATHVYSANEAPASHDQTDAYFDRWIIIPFERRFRDTAQENPYLSRELTAPDELEGVLVRAVRGLRDLWERGRFNIPESVARAGAAYREHVDTVATFVEEKCVVDVSKRQQRSSLYAAYRDWCETQGKFPVSGPRFYEKLRADLGDRITDAKSNGVRYMVGIAEAPLS